MSVKTSNNNEDDYDIYITSSSTTRYQKRIFIYPWDTLVYKKNISAEELPKEIVGFSYHESITSEKEKVFNKILNKWHEDKVQVSMYRVPSNKVNGSIEFLCRYYLGYDHENGWFTLIKASQYKNTEKSVNVTNKYEEISLGLTTDNVVNNRSLLLTREYLKGFGEYKTKSFHIYINQSPILGSLGIWKWFKDKKALDGSDCGELIPDENNSIDFSEVLYDNFPEILSKENIPEDKEVIVHGKKESFMVESYSRPNIYVPHSFLVLPVFYFKKSESLALVMDSKTEGSINSTFKPELNKKLRTEIRGRKCKIGYNYEYKNHFPEDKILVKHFGNNEIKFKSKNYFIPIELDGVFHFIPVSDNFNYVEPEFTGTDVDINLNGTDYTISKNTLSLDGFTRNKKNRYLILDVEDIHAGAAMFDFEDFLEDYENEADTITIKIGDEDLGKPDWTKVVNKTLVCYYGVVHSSAEETAEVYIKALENGKFLDNKLTKTQEKAIPIIKSLPKPKVYRRKQSFKFLT